MKSADGGNQNTIFVNLNEENTELRYYIINYTFYNFLSSDHIDRSLIHRRFVSYKVLMQIREKDFQAIYAANDRIMMISGNED